MNAREQARQRDELARRRVAREDTERRTATRQAAVVARLEARVRYLERGELPEDRDELEALREELVERLDRVEALLFVPGAHWQRLAA